MAFRAFQIPKDEATRDLNKQFMFKLPYWLHYLKFVTIFWLWLATTVAQTWSPTAYYLLPRLAAIAIPDNISVWKLTSNFEKLTPIFVSWRLHFLYFLWKQDYFSMWSYVRIRITKPRRHPLIPRLSVLFTRMILQ